MKTNWDYRTIKAKAKGSRCSVRDFLACGSTNDPFYADLAFRREAAEWFASLWKSGLTEGQSHTRGIHYKLISKSSRDPIMMPNGKRYEHTNRCYAYLETAARDARFLGLVDARQFKDKKSGPAKVFAQPNTDPKIGIESETTFVLDFPDFPDPPTYTLEGFKGVQKYIIEIWIEKSGMEDILTPLCEKYGCNLVTGGGEISLTHCTQFIDRAMRFDRPARILYISDMDMGGRSMPVSVARKIEFFLRSEYPDLDVQLDQIVLTPKQCKEYDLPKTPAKENENASEKGKAIRQGRKARFEAIHGKGVTELDALDALHPGEFAEIVENKIRSFYDDTLDERVAEAENDILGELVGIEDTILSDYGGQIEEIRTQYAEIKARFEAEVLPLKDRIENVYAAIQTRMYDTDLPDLDVPEAEIDPENEWQDPLFDSARDYEDQIGHYKRFQTNGESE
jgi:hypothetical protein